ncbi:MAG: type II toxin-antitoxin system VapC family toxin [Pleurocapsa sp.]
MAYLLDTCTLSDYIKGDRSTMARLKAEKPSNIYISAITRFEIEYGLQLKPSLIKQVSSQLESIYQKTRSLDFTPIEAKTTAIIRADLKKMGQPIGFYDLLIAGMAATHDLIVVTSNVDEFSRVEGLEVENWR